MWGFFKPLLAVGCLIYFLDDSKCPRVFSGLKSHDVAKDLEVVNIHDVSIKTGKINDFFYPSQTLFSLENALKFLHTSVAEWIA